VVWWWLEWKDGDDDGGGEGQVKAQVTAMEEDAVEDGGEDGVGGEWVEGGMVEWACRGWMRGGARPGPEAEAGAVNGCQSGLGDQESGIRRGQA
jgi:hypothetical protein